MCLQAWSALDFPAGPAAAGQGRYAVREVVWAADYLTACHLAPYRYVGLIGDPGKFGNLHACSEAAATWMLGHMAR